MRSKILLLISPALLLCSILSTAQKKLSDAEVQDFFQKIKGTKEYRAIRSETDSINKAGKNNVPQEVDVELVKQDTNDEGHTFRAQVKRTVLGMAVESYLYTYYQQKKQIIQIDKAQGHFR
jgi:hypothetical protein